MNTWDVSLDDFIYGYAGKRTRFKHRNILNIIRCKLIRLIFFRFLLVKRLAITVKVSTFALAFGKQGLVRPRGTGAEERRVHWKSYIKRESSTRAWMFFGEDVVLLRGYPRVKKKRTVMIPVYAGHIRGCEKKREKRVSSGSPETEQMPFPYG